MVGSRNCYFCKYYKDEYCENLELKPCYPQKGCEDFSKRNELKGDAEEIHKLILELLEQETVSKEVYDHEYFLRKEFELKIDKLQRQLEEQAVKAEAILDKIRAEIEQLPTSTCTETYRMSIDAVDFKENVLAIIDKYRAKSEG